MNFDNSCFYINIVLKPQKGRSYKVETRNCISGQETETCFTKEKIEVSTQRYVEAMRFYLSGG